MSLSTTNKPICLLNTIWTKSATTIIPFWTSRSFSRTSKWYSSKNKQQKTDPRVTLIRYHMQHPLMARPLRLSRGRALRHWTIAQAWDIWEKKKKIRANLELQRQYQSMQLAMEVLRNLDDGTNSNGKIGSRLFRTALEKKGIYKTGSIPIEYSRLQTETPGATSWDHNWKR
ncbi:hypothetical protein OnM2_057030 [Erysiphe neolycopersici]|uniref:Uncharacterized protein n=1 Tax=Erysiphe neolycopersici TaxID=212602 RepID=A0A420HR00_9PEZI|nr:hypothetical protein OnM2_057030 [Erysiphe neolycopersici]